MMLVLTWRFRIGVVHRLIERNKEFVNKSRHGDKAMPPSQRAFWRTAGPSELGK